MYGDNIQENGATANFFTYGSYILTPTPNQTQIPDDSSVVVVTSGGENIVSLPFILQLESVLWCKFCAILYMNSSPYTLKKWSF